ncbi:hypothetical protein V6N13_008896 [Hibiscus sabdariffa]
MKHEEESEVSEIFVTCEANEEQEISEAETEVESVLVKNETSSLFLLMNTPIVVAANGVGGGEPITTKKEHKISVPIQ